MTTPNTDLTEQIARALYSKGHPALEDAWDNPGNLAQAPQWRDRWRKSAAAVLPIVEQAVKRGQAEALRDAAYEFADGAWSDQWIADDVCDDVSAVQSTERWFNARADTIEKEADQ